ncbi:NADH-quinone oxidoreductase subunit C [Streptomyces sp. NPDC051776]|uniref:NADH-quinone oxidoreductase subunit C n=1 Tax=Streptomyces sp. NPDC051776 TaxID=3155414 RepID=UPI003436E863
MSAAEPTAAAESPVGWLPRRTAELFGEEATAEQAYDLLTVDVPPAAWLSALETARDTLGCTYFDWLSAVDEPGAGFRVSAHVVALPAGAPGSGDAPAPDAGSAHARSTGPRRLLVRTTVSHEAPVLPTATGVYAGAAWHERETREMFGVDFTGHPHLVPLLLPDGFEGHPLRKDFVLAARVAKAWPGAKEPGESEHGGPKRRQMLPPGVPDPNEWGPLKGQLPPAPARPARGARAAGGERPPRRARTAGAASPRATGEATGANEAAGAPEAAVPERPARRTRSASQGSVSQRSQRDQGAAKPQPAGAQVPMGEPDAAKAPGPTGTEATTPTADTSGATGVPGSAGEQAAEAPEAPKAVTPETGKPQARASGAPDGRGAAPAAERPVAGRRSSDAPWHHARPAFDDDAGPEAAEPRATDGAAVDEAAPDADRTPGSPDEASGPADSDGAAADAEPPAREPGTPPAREPDTLPTHEPDTPPTPEPGTPQSREDDAGTPPRTDDDGGESA